MACKYFYDNKEYTFDEFASLLESGLADELVAKNVLSSSGVYNKKAPVDAMPGAITINSSNTNVPLGKGKNPLTTLARQTQNMVKALNKLTPNISFTIHATEDSWNQLKDQMLSDGTDISGMDGFYDPNTNQVHLNYPLMKELGRFNTGFHEGYHPLTNALFDSRPDLRNSMFNQLVLMANDNQLSKEFRDQVKEVLDFGDQYRGEYGANSVMDESIVEFLSRVSSGQIAIDGNNKSLLAHIKQFLNNLAEMLNIGVMIGNKEYTVDNLLDFARSVDFAFKQGVAIDFDPRSIPTNQIFNTKEVVDSIGDKFLLQPSITNYGTSGLIKTPILDTKELDESIKKGNVTIQNPYKFIGNANFMKTFPDDLFVGDLKIGKDTIASGDGGIFYAAKNGDKGGAWASVNEQTANSFVNNANESLEINKEKGIPFGVVALVKGDKIKHQTSLQGKAGMVNVILSLTQNEDGTANQEVLSALNKLYNLGTTSKNVKKIQADINSMLSGGRSEASQTMSEAKNFYQSFRSELIKSAGKELGLMVEKLGLENVEKYYNKSKLKSGEKVISNDGFDLLYQTLFAEDAIKEIKPGEAYAALVFNSKLEVAPEDTEHPSYPFPIRTVDGSPVKLVVFSKTFPAYDNRSDEDKKAGVKKVIATVGREPNKAGDVSEGAFGAASYTKPVYTLDSSAEDNSPFQYNLLDEMNKYSATKSMGIMPSLAGEFVSKLNETKESDPKQYWSVDTVSLEDAKEGTVIKTEAGYGFVSQSGDIKGVFKANKESAEKTGDEVLKKAVKAGGIKLDNFDGYLTKIYERNGFVIASRIPFNEEYAPEGWNKEAHGTPDVVAMVYDPYKQLDVEEKRFEDYMEGIDYRDSFVDLAYGNAVTNGAMPPRIDARPNDLVSASPIVYDMTEDGNGNYVFYTDKVSGNNADVNKEGMLELSTEKKSIQPSMVKIPYESTYPLDTNPLGIKGETNKEILQQAKNLGFVAVVNKDMEGNAVVMSDTVMPVEKIGTTEHLPNKQAIQPSLGWAGSKGVQEIKVGPSGLKAMAPVSPIKGNVKELSNRQQSAFFNNFRTFFSATQGNSQAAKSLQENLLGEKDEITNQIDKIAIEMSKLVKSFAKSDAAKTAGLSQDTIHRIVNGAMIGESDPRTGTKFIDMLPQDLAETVISARQSVVTLQEVLVQTGLLPAEIEAIIATTIGSYSKRSFYAFELPKKKGLFSMFSKQKKSTWFESVPQEVREKARAMFTSMAMNGTLDNGFNIALNEYKKNYEDPYLALIAVDPSMQSNATQQAAMAMTNALDALKIKAGEFADSVMRRIEDVNEAGDVNFTIGGSVVTMKDYIEKNPALPKEIRDYLGEIKDPAINFRLTAMKLTRMLYNHQTVSQFKNLGLQSGDVVTASEPTPAGWIKLGDVTKADVKGKKGTATDEMDALNRYGALKGCSITPALYDLLFDKPIEGTLYYKYITTNVKKFKTIYSPSTQIKNLYGYAFFGLTSGAIPEGLYYSSKIASAAYKQISTKEGFMNYWNEIFVEAKRRGINTSLEIQEINRVGRELSENKELLNSLKDSKSPATEIYQFFTEMYTNTENLFKQGMMLGDAIPKTIMFEIFRNGNAAIMNSTSYYELDERQKELANEMAARKVKLTTVTDTRTIKGIDFIQRKMGIFGTFPRFLSESVRNFVNAHLLIANPGMLHEGLILSDNPTKDAEIKKQMDIKTRAVGMAGLSGYYGLMALLKAAISFGDDDDDKVNAGVPSNAIMEASQIYNKPKGTLTQSEALRMLVPEYDRFADLSFEVKKDGTIEYKNESSVDPFNVFPQAFRSYIYSDNVATGTANAVKQVADPVIGWEILFGTALEIINNENSKGNVIYKNYDDFVDKSSDVLAYAFRKVGPGIATSSMRYKDLVTGGQREGGAFGYINFMLIEGSKGRISTMDVESKLKSKVSEINNAWIDDQRSYKGEFYKDKSEQERAKLNQERDKNAQMFAYELSQLVEAGYTLGMTTGQVKQVFKDARVSKKVRNAAMRGGSAIERLNINDIKEN